jgi:1-acyl-sn-glycerol-3-phosphate acyltransferase
MSNKTAGHDQATGMTPLSGDGGTYQTAPRDTPMLSRLFPSGAFYSRLLPVVCRAAAKAKRGRYDDREWHSSSLATLRALEHVGVRLEISGMEHLKDLGTPCVIVGNHMSMLETFVLPCVIRPFMPVTFVVKESLLTYPVFGHVMCSRDPVAVSRTNPREDFATVMTGGRERLDKGISIIVFPQTTRTGTFDPGDFNTIGVKLARRAGVPVVPLALCTDAWSNGTLVKDLGKIDVSRPVHLAFGAPLTVEGNGAPTNEAVIRFIQEHMDKWRA